MNRMKETLLVVRRSSHGYCVLHSKGLSVAHSNSRNLAAISMVTGYRQHGYASDCFFFFSWIRLGVHDILIVFICTSCSSLG